MLTGAGVLFAALMAWDAGSLDPGDTRSWRLAWLGGLLFAGGVGSMLRATLAPE